MPFDPYRILRDKSRLARHLSRAQAVPPYWRIKASGGRNLEHFSGRLDVLVHLGHELIRAGETLFVAQPVHKGDLGRLAVEVPVEVEEVRLEHRGNHIVEGGSASEGHRGAVDRAVGPLVPAGVDALGRHGHIGGYIDVGGGKAEQRSPPARASPDDAAHLMRSPENLGRLSYRAPGDELSDPGGGHDLSPTVVLQAHADDIEAVSGAHLGQQRDVALAAMAEVEVLTHHHEAGAKRADEDFEDEVLRRLIGPLHVEGHHHGEVDPRGGQQLELLVKVGEKRRGGVGAHDGGRMAVEGDHRGRQRSLLRHALELTDEMAVAEVHPVIGPDSHGGAPRRRQAILWSHHDAHRYEVRQSRPTCRGAQPAETKTHAATMRSVAVASYTANSSPAAFTSAQGPSPPAASETRSSGSPWVTSVATSSPTSTWVMSLSAWAGVSTLAALSSSRRWAPSTPKDPTAVRRRLRRCAPPPKATPRSAASDRT